MRDIDEWLVQLGLDRYVDVFIENEIDFEAARYLTADDLKELGLPMGPRKKLLAAIRELAMAPDPGHDVTRAPPTRRSSRQAERRQLTVMFCDMVGSTQLSRILDPEHMRDVLSQFQNTCAAVIARYEGFIARYMGDGILVYFGYPKAHEDDAERAIRAGLDIVAALDRLDPAPQQQPLAARIAIATGPVVVGDLIGEGPAKEETVIGETPNLAARLQSFAAPNTVVIAAATRRLLGSQFDYEHLGRHDVKGFAEPVEALRVVAARAVETRFAAMRAATPTPLVGRDREIALLLDRWSQAKTGEGQVVLVSGEAGIGKSRILLDLEQAIGGDPHAIVRFQCAPYHQNSAFWPVVEHLRRTAAFRPDDSDEQRLDRLVTLLEEVFPSLHDRLPVFAALLSVPTGDGAPPLDLGAERRKEETLQALLAYAGNLAGRQPLLMVFEDIHWIDPSTQEFLDLVVERAQTLPAIIAVTFRPEFDPPWTGQPHVTLLVLNRMTLRQCAAMVDELTGGRALPGNVLDHIVTRTDGVPLFIEELTKLVLESGLVEEVGGRFVLKQPLPALGIPKTLQDSLMARLDQLATAKGVAQIGAAVGRDFSYELLETIAPLPPRELNTAIDRLEASGLVFRRGARPHATYTFKHALIRDAAYASLLKSRCHQLHAQIADTLEEHFPGVVETEPETLAYHCTEAGLVEKAVEYWTRAGERAVDRAANVEAIEHFGNAIKIAAELPDPECRARREVTLRLKAATTMRVIERFDEAFEQLDRAEAVASGNDLQAEFSRIHHCRGNLCFPVGDAEGCLREHRLALDHAGTAASPADEAQALGGLGDAFYLQGRMRQACEHFKRCARLSRRHGLVGIEVTTLHMIGWTRMYLNELREAAEDGHCAAAKAQSVKQYRAWLLAKALVGFVGIDLGDDRAEEELDQAVEIARKVGTKAFESAILAHKARFLLAHGKRAAARPLADQAQALLREAGVGFFGPYVLGVWSRAADDEGLREAAWKEAEETLGVGCVSHNYFWFYREAIEASLELADWDRAEGYAAALARYASREPMPWSDFYAARARALAAIGRGVHDEGVREELKRLCKVAEDTGHRTALSALETALSSV